MSAGVGVRGTWPGLVTIRSGWWKAIGRPLNDQSTDAVLRVERGSSEFTRRAAEALLAAGATAVNSTPMMPGTGQMYVRAGFAPHTQLLLMERDLRAGVADVDGFHESDEEERIGALDIDEAAFDGPWRVGRLGIEDALAATPEAAMLSPDHGAGFAIVGIAMDVGYLQRVAVHPDDQGTGVGRLLVRASMAWARQRGARTMMLNTQMDNDRAAALYHSEGFRTLTTRLTIHRFAP